MKPMMMAALGCFALTVTTAAAAPAYLVAEYEVTDASALKEWGQATAPMVKAYGGQFVSRGHTPVAAVGEPPKRATIVLFESMEKAQAYLSAPEYTALAPKRDKAAKFRSFLVSGGEATTQ
jgi:uncharacterized protein (DUF1330 family)